MKENTQTKIIQIIIVVILLISAFYMGKLSMKEQIYDLFNLIEQLETQINQTQTEIPDKSQL